jgi:predicted PolB exonuclease-like 3'-5' exonuclease
MGMAGDEVWDNYRDGQLEKIRDYCETDVLNTYLIFLRFQHMRGILDDVQLAAEFDRVRELLGAASEPHLTAFLDAWTRGPVPAG